MKIYIASSWKNQHGVEMLTALLREKGHEVISWIENNYGESHNHVTKEFPFEEWVNSEQANQSFVFDTTGATKSDLVIYYGPAGKDACAEMGAAWASDVPIIGLFAKGEDLGLMRKMVTKWYSRYMDLLNDLNLYVPNPFSCFGNQIPSRIHFEDNDEYMKRLENWKNFEENRNSL